MISDPRGGEVIVQNILGLDPVGITDPSAAFGLILARLYLRIILQRRRLLASDLFMCAGWCISCITACFDIHFYKMGVMQKGVTLGLVGFEGTAEEASEFLKLYHVTDYTFHSAFYFSKAALLCVYLQVFPEFMVKRRQFLWAVIAFVTASFTAVMLLLTVSCLPTWRWWALADEGCPIQTLKMMFQIAWALNITGDILIFILPWLVVPELTLRPKLRYSLYATFGLGIINILFTIVRFALIQKYGADLVITITLVELWSFMDSCVGLIIACLPSLRPYFNCKEKIQYYGNDSKQSKADSQKPIMSSNPDTVDQPANAYMSIQVQRTFSVAW
ncbi:hypothetical protein HYE67_001917 [Fusarium culmorum]|uniref:Rhodopsin domain-containing protein n=1 Tax=Fusarium culmorum TaxID=5516 RepID=A0A7S8D0G7_FUSCU|nr:hypothetical protein HYE67_001917 [Fusarium culmorum]